MDHFTYLPPPYTHTVPKKSEYIGSVIVLAQVLTVHIIEKDLFFPPIYPYKRFFVNGVTLKVLGKSKT